MRILGIKNVGDVPGDSPYDSSDDDKQEYLNRLVHAILQETVPSLPTANTIIDSADFEDNYPFCCCKTGNKVKWSSFEKELHNHLTTCSLCILSITYFVCFATPYCLSTNFYTNVPYTLVIWFSINSLIMSRVCTCMYE